jgi:hypothetical protein
MTWWEEPIRRLVRGRRVVLAGGVPPMWHAEAELVTRLGATAVMVVATEGEGIGEGPDVPTVTVEPPDGLDPMERIRWGIDALGAPVPEVVRAVDAFDPDGVALVLGVFLNESPSFAGRPFLWHRRPEALALDDKTVVDRFWDDAGVARAPSIVVPVAEAWRASTVVDAGHGVVWAADSRDGWHGGGQRTRWVVDADQARAVVEELQPVCDQVRVMPFLEGIPCSVHGIVCADGSIVLRPVEMVTLRRGSDLFYAGCATFWDPVTALRDEMRDVARRVARELDAALRYRGAFTVDGVATAHGFLPTELNTRPGAGLSVIGRSLGDVPLMFLVDLVAAGLDLGRSAERLEEEWLAMADERRGGGTWRFWGVRANREVSDLALHFRGGEWSDVEPPLPGPRATVSAAGAGARCAVDAATWPTGPSFAPAAVAFYRWCDDHLGTSFGELRAPVDAG